MKSYKKALAGLLALLLLVSVSAFPAMAESGNAFGIEKYVALGDSYVAGLNDDPEIGAIPKVPTGKVDENGEPEKAEIFGTSQTGHATRLARMLGLSGAGRVDQNRPDDGYRSWAYCGMRTKDLLHYLDPSFPHDDDDLFFQFYGSQSNYKLYLDDMAADIRAADLITLGIGGNDFFSGPVVIALTEMEEDYLEDEKGILALNAALEIAQEEEEAGDGLAQIMDLLKTAGFLAEFMARFGSRMMEGYQEMVTNFPKIVAKLREMNPDGQIVLDHIPNPFSSWSLTGSEGITFGEILGSVLIPANLVIDATAAQYDCDVVETADVEVDSSMHPSNDGYQTIAQRTYDVLRPVERSFRDVEKGSWYDDAVSYVTAKGIMAGTSADTFSPDAAVTRAMVAQIFYAAEGKPAVSGKTAFSDVMDGKWYTDAVNWCAENALAGGYPDGTFRPEKAVTREELATMLFSYHQKKTDHADAVADVLAKYSDADEIHPYAVASMEWAVSNSLLTGFEDGTIRPTGTATRAQLAVILQQYDKL